MNDDIIKDEDFEGGYFPEGTVHQDVYFKLGYVRFVWDKAKSDKCLRERGFDFRTAAMVFNDDDCLYDEDEEHSEGEKRMYALGRPTAGEVNATETFIGTVDKVLYVVYTERALRKDGTIDENAYRIISARQAEPDEKEAYEMNKYRGYEQY